MSGWDRYENVVGFSPARRSRRRTFRFRTVLVLCAVGSFLVVYALSATSMWQTVRSAFETPALSGQSEQVAAQMFFSCGGGRMPTCVIDGDTIRLNGTSIRIADIDTPEVFSPQCSSELERGNLATRRMVQLLSGGGFEMVRYDHRDEDVYGRKLRVLVRDGQSIGQILVAEGLARTWDGARHSWC